MAKEKKFRQLSDEELEKVNGGVTTCWTDDMDYCQKKQIADEIIKELENE